MTGMRHHTGVRTLAILLLLMLLTAYCRPLALETTSPTVTVPVTITAPPGTAEDAFLAAREAMVSQTIVARGVSDPQVIEALRTVPREQFVPETYLNQAYADHPLPIGYGQTISQPYIVAWMTELLALKPGDRVLEIGTGSGYQAAILAEIEGVEVYTMEIIPELATEAASRLETLGYTAVHAKQGDGYYGWPEAAPFDAIIVTAAPDHLPQPLAEQLAEGGRLVIPIGPQGGWQNLWQFTKENGELRASNLGGVIFVPLTGEGTGQR